MGEVGRGKEGGEGGMIEGKGGRNGSLEEREKRVKERNLERREFDKMEKER